MNKLKILGIVAVFLLLACLVGTAQAGAKDTKIPKDWYDETIEAWDIDPIEHIMGGYESYGDVAAISDFKPIKKPLDESIKKPDEINEELIKSFVMKKIDETNYWGQIKLSISPTDFAVYLAAAKDPWATVGNKLVYLDVDGDKKPEVLWAVYHYPYASWYAAEHLYPKLEEGHYIHLGSEEFFINPFDVKDDLGPLPNLLYIEDPSKIAIVPGPDGEEEIDWWKAVGKTPRELGLDEYDREIFGRTPSQTSSAAQTAPPSGIPTGEEKGIPGFEAIFAVAGLLGVAYIFRRQNK